MLDNFCCHIYINNEVWQVGDDDDKEYNGNYDEKGMLFLFMLTKLIVVVFADE